MESVVTGISSLFQLAFSGIQQTLKSRLLDAQGSADTSSLVMDCLNCENQYTKIFQGLETSSHLWYVHVHVVTVIVIHLVTAIYFVTNQCCSWYTAKTSQARRKPRDT